MLRLYIDADASSFDEYFTSSSFHDPPSTSLVPIAHHSIESIIACLPKATSKSSQPPQEQSSKSYQPPFNDRDDQTQKQNRPDSHLDLFFIHQTPSHILNTYIPDLPFQDRNLSIDRQTFRNLSFSKVSSCLAVLFSIPSNDLRPS